jgi:predicted permease
MPHLPGRAVCADCRYALRNLCRSPGFTAVAVAILALGIGANTALFSVVHAIYLRQLPVQAPEGLVLLVETDGTRSRDRESYQLYQYLRQHSGAFSGIVAASAEPAVWMGSNHSEFINVEIVTGDYFEMLGLRPAAGRLIQAEDDQSPGAHPVAVLSHAFWKRHFAADPGVAGRTIALAGGTFVIIGVAPKDFSGLEIDQPADLWVPLMMTPQVRPGLLPWNPLPRSNWLHLVGRLKPGVSQRAAAEAASVAYRQWQESLAGDDGGRAGGRRGAVHSRIALRSAQTGFSAVRGPFSRPLLVIMIAVGGVLIVSCINVANMLLARAVARQKEIGIRLALGSSTGRLAQQFLVEGVLLALLGGLAGLLFAVQLAGVVLRFAPWASAPAPFDVGPDLKVIGLTLTVSLLSGALFSLAPALWAAKSEVNAVLRGGPMWAGSRRFGWRNLMVMAQITMSLVILVGAGLFVRTLRNLQQVEPGFAAANVSVLEFNPQLSGYTEQDHRRFLQEALLRLGRLPGVSAVSFANLYSFNGSSERTSIQGEGNDEGMDVETSYVGPSYFTTLGAPILRGREFTMEECRANEKDVAIISPAVARGLFGDADPIGKHILRPPYRYTVVGVAGSVRYNSLREASPGILYTPGPWGYSTLLVRTQARGSAMSSVLQRAAEGIDRRVPVRRVSTLDRLVTQSLSTERLLAGAAAALGLLVSLLAAVGVYGVVSYAVNRRTAEFGVHMALGANRADILLLVLRETLLAAGLSILAGLPAAMLISRLISSMLYGLSAEDPATIGLAVALVLGTALVASCPAAVRAMRLDASTALRSQ